MIPLNQHFKKIFPQKILLEDYVRTNSFRKAILKAVKKDDTVVDIGAGTGILSFFACQAGARKVYAIEKDKMLINLAKSIAIKNKLNDKIVFINKDFKSVFLKEKADVIVGELLGYFGIDENVVDVFNTARKRLLKKDGIIIPSMMVLFLVPFESEKFYNFTSGFWRNLYGLDYSPVNDKLIKSPVKYRINLEDFLSKPNKVYNIDFTRSNKKIQEIRSSFQFIRDGNLHGFCGFFRSKLFRDVFIDTSPSQPETSWKQYCFPIKEPIKVRKNDKVYLKILLKVKENRVNYKWCYEIV